MIALIVVDKLFSMKCFLFKFELPGYPWNMLPYLEKDKSQKKHVHINCNIWNSFQIYIAFIRIIQDMISYLSIW